MPTLFDSFRMGDLTLPNRIIMAPLTRSRASAGRVPNALMAEYYRQRASAGLIISEATSVTPMGVGYPDTPGIWSQAQIEGWREVTDAVHQAGGRIYLQLWHVGRISHPSYLDGRDPVAPSAIAANGPVRRIRPKTLHPIPRALEADEIPGVIEDYRRGAENAQLAGFDGVEIHGANGYLLDQFLQTASNHRDDAYGGSIEHRARLLLEVTDACIEVWGAQRVGVHLAPRGDTHSMGDENPEALFGYVADQLGIRDIAFICAREYLGEDSLGPMIKRRFGGPFIANEKFDLAQAEAAIERGDADAVAFGELYIANPDLVERFERRAALNVPEPETFYSEGAHGYTDYPTLGA